MSKIRERFIRDLRIRNYSSNTINIYVHSIDRLSKHFNLCPSEISEDQIKDYLNSQFVTNSSWSATNIMISACNLLFKDTLNQPEKLYNIKRPKMHKKLPVVLSREEVESMLNVIRNVKHRAIMMTIYGAGLRCGEAQKLKIRDIDSKRDRIIIRDAKGHKDREVFLARKLLEFLRFYVRSYRPKDYLFPGQKDGAPLSVGSMRKVLKRAVNVAKINKDVKLHTLRHSFATHLLDDGVDVRIIQKLLGHKSVKTTMLYCHLSDDRFREARSPLDNLNL